MPPLSQLICQKVLSPPLSSVGSGDSLVEFAANAPCWHVSFSADGNCLAACYGAPDCCARVWDTRSGALLATLKDLHTRTVRCCAFAPIAKSYTLATASFDGSIGIWEDTTTNRTGQDKNDNDEWDCIAQLEGHDSEVKCVEWNPTASLLATSGRDKTIWLWDCTLEGNIGGGNQGGDFECLAVLNGHDGDVKSVVFASSHRQFGDGDEIVISASYDNTIRVWAEDGGDWYCAAILNEAHTVWSLAVAPGATRFISGSADASIGIYKFYTAQECKILKADRSSEQEIASTPNQGMFKCVGRLPQAHLSEVLKVSYASSKAGHGRFASCGDALHVYREAIESSSDHPLFAREASSSRMNLNAVQWHPKDGSVLATAGDDGNVRIWKYGRSVTSSSAR